MICSRRVYTFFTSDTPYVMCVINGEIQYCDLIGYETLQSDR